MNRRDALLIAAILFALLVGFIVGRVTSPRVTVERSTMPGWVELRSHGEVIGEYNAERDPLEFDALDGALEYKPKATSPTEPRS